MHSYTSKSFCINTLFYPVKLPQQPNTLLVNAGRFRRELCLPSTQAPLSDLGSSTQQHPLHMNDAFYLQFVSFTLKTWMNFYCVLQPGARIFPEPFKSPYQQPTSNTQTEALAHMCWCWSVMLADRQCNGKKNRAYGNIIKFPIPAKQAIRYAILANGMVNQLYSTDGFFFK